MLPNTVKLEAIESQSALIFAKDFEIMNWENLLSLKRYGDVKPRLRKNQDETRLGFDVDYDRIIFSSAFRRLQDKTQVMPMPIAMGNNKNFVHTRLTHSLEVSVVARSLGRKVGQALLDKYPYLKHDLGYHFNDFGAIVAAAALAHDIGNPPFGHSGEKAIGAFFAQGNGKHYQSQMTAKEYQDLVDFEGNANGFKLLVESKEGIQGGLRLSYATLGAFLKYPKESLPKKPTKDISDKKFGFFQSQRDFFLELTQDLGLLKKDGKALRYHRHPLTFLVEAADDICYTIIDFEDGINLGLISEDFALEYLINLVKDKINTKKYNQIKKASDKLSYLRALAIGTLVDDATEIFLTNEQEILNGTFEKSLLDVSKFEPQITDIISLCVKKMYQSDEVVEKELAGYHIISNLLQSITAALIKKKNGDANTFDNLLLKSLGIDDTVEQLSIYETLLLASSYVAGLSDGGAVHLNQMISGNRI